MISLVEAQQRILDAVAPLAPRPVPLAAARGLVLAQDVIAGEMVPPFANTAMDGYAVRAADTYGVSDGLPGYLDVVGAVRMGCAPDVRVSAGTVVTMRKYSGNSPHQTKARAA